MIELLNPLQTFNYVMWPICCLTGATQDIVVVELSMSNAVCSRADFAAPVQEQQ